MSARHPPSGYYMGFTISTLIPNEVIISQNLATLGMMSPFSTREIYDLVELIRLASSAWVTFASLRAFSLALECREHHTLCQVQR